MNARDEILQRVRDALSDVDGAAVHVPTGHRDRIARSGLTALFVERVQDYRATVTHCVEADVPATVTSLLPEGVRVVLPPGLPWSVTGTVDEGMSPVELDRYGAVVTAATLGIAETGTIVLTHGPGEGRRAISLVPDVHVCVIGVDQVVADVPHAIARLDPSGPQTWVSGPSATSDIELDRVEGVHGPRRLHVVLVG